MQSSSGAGKDSSFVYWDEAVEAAAASSRVSAKPVPHPRKEGQVRPRVGCRAGRELGAAVGSATHPRGQCPAMAQSLESQLFPAMATLTSDLGLAQAICLS